MRMLNLLGRAVTVGSVLFALAGTVTVAAVHATGEQLLVAVSGSMTPVFGPGDAVLVHRPVPGELRVGQVIAFHPPGRTDLKTHRIYALRPRPTGLFVQTKGDANPAPDPDFTPARSVVGILDARLPYAGYWLVLYRSPRDRLIVYGLPLLLLLVAQLRDLVRRRCHTAAAGADPPSPAGGSTRRPIPAVQAAAVGTVTLLALTAAGVAVGRWTGAVYAASATVGGNKLSTVGCFYPRAVASAAPLLYYRLDDATATTAADSAASPHNGSYSGTWTTGVAGPLTCTPDSGVTAGGTTSYIAGSQQQAAPPGTFTLEAWIKTTSTNAEILGYGTARTGNSGSIPRVLYLDGTGHLVFGIATTASAARTVATTGTYNDGTWHLVDVRFSATTGTGVYVDGAPVTSDSTTTSYNIGAGYWRVGYDNLSGASQAWTPTTGQYTGSLDEVAVYPSALTASQVAAHYADR